MPQHVRRPAKSATRLATSASIVMLAAACGSGHHSAAGRPLPPGFSVTTTRPTLGPVAGLSIAPVTDLDPTKLRRAPFPKDKVATLAQAVADQPVPIKVRPLLVDATRLRPGLRVTFAAADLAQGRSHAALVTLQGPSFRAQRLVQITRGVTAGIVTLPASLAAGTWTLSAEDLSGVVARQPSKIAGTALMDLGVFTIS